MRKLSKSEINFIRRMLKASLNNEKFIHLLDDVFVMDSNSGGMGGVLFLSNKKNRSLGVDISSVKFQDSDGIDVMATLSLDNYGDLYELDIWKADFSPVNSLSGFKHTN